MKLVREDELNSQINQVFKFKNPQIHDCKTAGPQDYFAVTPLIQPPKSPFPQLRYEGGLNS